MFCLITAISATVWAPLCALIWTAPRDPFAEDEDEDPYYLALRKVHDKV